MIFFWAEILMELAETPNFKVLIVSPMHYAVWLIVQITAVLDLSDRLDCKILVNFESLKFI